MDEEHKERVQACYDKADPEGKHRDLIVGLRSILDIVQREPAAHQHRDEQKYSSACGVLELGSTVYVAEPFATGIHEADEDEQQAS